MKQTKLILFAFLVTATSGVRAQLTTIAPALVQKSTAHYIGEKYGGGIVFFIYDKGEHGLIAATADQSTNQKTGVEWYNGIERYTGTTGDGLGAGLMNTAMIVATQMTDNQTGIFAAKLCADYSVTEGEIPYGDWYLPSKYELSLLYIQKDVVGGFANDFYWSSSEDTVDGAWARSFTTNGVQSFYNKGSTYLVRAVRTF